MADDISLRLSLQDDASAKLRQITYAIPFISGAMHSYIANTYNIFHIPQYMRRRLREYERILQESDDISPSDYEICEKLSISAKSLDELKRTKQKIEYYSFDKSVPDGDETLYGIVSNSYNTENRILELEYKRELHNALEKAFSILDKKTVQIIKSIYYTNFTKTRIAQIMNCSESYIGAKIERAFKKIREVYGEELAEFMWDGFRYKEDNTMKNDNNEFMEQEECNLFLI
ncbi:MAG: hypothetical protein MJ097_02220 [Dorea sp.]|nr:hypothetical protein [Dorea sp.]